MNFHGEPRAVFGRRASEIRAPAARNSAAPKPTRAIGRLMCLLVLTSLLLAVVGGIFWSLQVIAKQNAETARAEQSVIEIVNQPITHLSRSGPVGIFSPGWFHPGAKKPDFNNVDVHTTQEFPYDGYGHVTSDLNPTEMFIGNELEFNSMTKYFYTDLRLPKRRLSDTEMDEINSLYRVVGRNEQAIPVRWLSIAGLVAVGFCLGFALLLLIRRPDLFAVE